MKIIGERRGGAGTLPCENCDGKTGVLYTVEKDGKTTDICTSCRSILSMISQGKGDIITRLWQAKSGTAFVDKT